MDVVLISSRGAAAAPHWSRAATAAAAAALVARGARVRWLCALRPDEALPTPQPGVELRPLVAAVPPFRAVEGRSSDTALDVELARALRRQPSQVVAHLGFGAPGTVTSLWLGDRMGARVVAAVQAAEVLCHRGTLIEANGAACSDFLDAARCARCCNTPSPQGPTAAAAAWARALRVLGGLSPFPSLVHFQNRADLALASLQLASAVIAGSAREVELLTTAGLLPRTLQAAPADGTVAALVDAVVAAATAI